MAEATAPLTASYATGWGLSLKCTSPTGPSKCRRFRGGVMLAGTITASYTTGLVSDTESPMRLLLRVYSAVFLILKAAATTSSPVILIGTSILQTSMLRSTTGSQSRSDLQSPTELHGDLLDLGRP